MKVTGDGVGGAVGPRELEERSERIRRAVEDLYEVALAGQPAALLVHFAGEARDQVRPERLMISAAEPERAVLKLRFLMNAHEHPVAAFAEVEFEGTTMRDDSPARVTQRGDYVLRRLNGAWRILSYRVHRRVSRARTETAFAPGLPSRDPAFILVIGSDARPGASVTHTRADSIHIVGVNPRLGRASVVGIPRDSWVQIPGAGTDKINAALVRGGPELLVDTVEQLAGLQIDGYVVTGFEGFTAIVDAVGGLDIQIPYAIDDALARADFEPGPDHLDGPEALSLSRARHDVPAGDFGRSLNQGRVMIAALGTLRE
ncbi:MAG: LCP family protein, partial [Actinomycetota bacterium]